jgi:hypothetical protein
MDRINRLKLRWEPVLADSWDANWIAVIANWMHSGGTPIFFSWAVLMFSSLPQLFD